MTIGIIGGSGLYAMRELEDTKAIEMDTPFGKPSDAYLLGRLHNRDVCFLPRHGKGHRYLPSEINYRANLYGFKQLGVDQILSVSAVGSLRDELRPRDLVLPDQYFDRTKNSAQHTFFGRGIVAHIPFGAPVCRSAQADLFAVAVKHIRENAPDIGIHNGGTYVNMEGPAFSSRAESLFHRKMGFDIIGMTSLAEAKLSREAEICYLPIAMVTDYDCWHETSEAVHVDMVLENMKAGIALIQSILSAYIATLPEERHCSCQSALQNTIMTAPEDIPDAVKKTLWPMIGKYLS